MHTSTLVFDSGILVIIQVTIGLCHNLIIVTLKLLRTIPLRLFFTFIEL